MTTRLGFSTVLTLAACLGAGLAASPASAVTRGGTMTYGRYADSLLLDPVLNDANVDIWILSNLYDTLLLPTDDGKGVQPGLASAYALAPDGLGVTLTLRDGIQFSDGSPITAEDVKWSLDRARDPKEGIWNFIDESIASVDIKDPKTVVLTLKHPDPAILAGLSVFNNGIMPKKLVEATPGATLDDKAKAYAEHPVGSGPFVLQSWSRGQEMKLVKNAHYWRQGTDGKPLPYLDGVTLEVLPDDATRLLKVQSGELDGAEFVPYSRVEELKADPKLDMVLFPSTKVEFGNFNVRPKLKDGSDNPLSKTEVRQALNYAADKDAIVAIVTHGVGTPMSSYMSSATPLHTGSGAQFPFDADKARALLKGAGFAGGFTMHCLVLAGSVDEIGIATALQQMWADVGVTLVIDQVDNATRTARYREGDFSMRLSLWTDDIADPSEGASYFGYFPNIQSQHSGWNDPEFNSLFEASQRELDGTKRAAQYARMQEIYRSGPIVPLYESPYPVVLKKGVQGFVQIPLGNNIFSGASIEK
ncbi:MAG: ABC transporter substrate-binding protein [Janthinobacterium lividum]